VAMVNTRSTGSRIWPKTCSPLPDSCTFHASLLKLKSITCDRLDAQYSGVFFDKQVAKVIMHKYEVKLYNDDAVDLFH